LPLLFWRIKFGLCFFLRPIFQNGSSRCFLFTSHIPKRFWSVYICEKQTERYISIHPSTYLSNLLYVVF
jgi:hypothetical protein